jgi:hypothetical protein
LEDRTLLSASLLFDAAAGNLSILGDAADTTVRHTFRVNLNGTEPGANYSQLQAAGVIDLGGSSLELDLTF